MSIQTVKQNLKAWRRFFLLSPLLCIAPAGATEQFADIHIHYNWDQKEVTSADQVLAKLQAHHVGLALLSSTPSHLALELKRKAPDTIVALFSPYTHELGKRDWYLDKSLTKKVDRALASGAYDGIGEIHFMDAYPPRPDNAVFVELMALAKKHDVPVLIHVDAANEMYFTRICRAHPQVKIIFAHAGGNLKPLHIERVLQQCPHTLIEFSARDPWRYGGLTDEQGLLKKEWRLLVERYPRRFMTGTDPVWRVTRTQSWDQADDGWDHYEELQVFHRQWLSQLSAAAQQRVQWRNAWQWFKGAPGPRPNPAED